MPIHAATFPAAGQSSGSREISGLSPTTPENMMRPRPPISMTVISPAKLMD